MSDVEKDLFGGDDEEEEVKGPETQTQTQTQTQPAVKGFLSDIFGDDDDEDDGIKGTGGGGLKDSDDELNDSSDDEVTTKRKSKLGKKSGKKKAKEEKGKKDKGKDKDGKGKKRKQPEVQVTSSGRISKKPVAPKDRPAAAGGAGGADDGGEYDSEEDAVATKEDRQFLADEDDRELKGVLAEYDDDDQNFDDERPRKKTKGGGGGGGSRSSSGKNLDPFSETLESMKKPKALEFAEADKARIAGDVLLKMSQAARNDDLCLQKHQPAVHKLNLLSTVQRFVNFRDLQSTLLEFDILREFSHWLRPLPDKSLPSLALRTAIYDMLAKLPCQSDHLKRADPDTKTTIGMTIVSLLKSKLETEENKRKIKTLVERWARPIYGKQTDARSASFEDNAEIRAVSIAHARAAVRDEQQRSVGDVFDASTKAADPYKRVRTPFSSGFLYTVKPDVQTVTQLDQSAGQSASRQSLIKKMKDTRGNAFNKKENPRAMQMAMSGRNKS